MPKRQIQVVVIPPSHQVSELRGEIRALRRSAARLPKQVSFTRAEVVKRMTDQALASEKKLEKILSRIEDKAP